MMTFLAMAEFSKLAIRSYRSKAKGTLEKVEGEGFQFTRIEVFPHIELDNVADTARAARILEKAESSCLISKSMKTPVRVSPTLDAIA
jgi:organic hydroperoxide reductase OsmC/OhrA